jgi:hypothetical protein
MYPVVLFLHVLAAHDPEILLAFESRFEKIGMPALLVQVASGLYMAHTLVPLPSQWLSFGSPLASLVGLKLSLLAVTVAAAVDARLRIIPTLSPATLPVMARRITLVTIVSVVFVAVGVSFRGGLLQTVL